jgi:uncharacterized RDD family membrane protein YckC
VTGAGPSFDPYQPPRAELELDRDAEPGGRAPDASRWLRFAGAFIDSAIAMVIFFPAQMWFGVYKNFPNVVQPSAVQTLGWAGLGFVLWVALHGYFLARNGQTIGKRLVSTRVVSVATEEKASLTQLIVVRHLPIALAGAVPVVGGILPLVDALFIFGKDRRCLHDRIAGTRVVKLR